MGEAKCAFTDAAHISPPQSFSHVYITLPTPCLAMHRCVMSFCPASECRGIFLVVEQTRKASTRSSISVFRGNLPCNSLGVVSERSVSCCCLGPLCLNIVFWDKLFLLSSSLNVTVPMQEQTSRVIHPLDQKYSHVGRNMTHICVVWFCPRPGGHPLFYC